MSDKSGTTEPGGESPEPKKDKTQSGGSERKDKSQGELFYIERKLPSMFGPVPPAKKPKPEEGDTGGEDSAQDKD